MVQARQSPATKHLFDQPTVLGLRAVTPVNPLRLGDCSNLVDPLLERCSHQFFLKGARFAVNEMRSTARLIHRFKRAYLSRSPLTRETLWSRALLLDPVEPTPVVPENLALGPVAQRKGHEALHRAGILRVGVRVVGRKYQIVVTEIFQVLPHRFLIGFDGKETVALEILRRLLAQL